ncbi:MAG TPA: YjfB family protein [Polyangiales bacterium]|nr:YjfB family protein [Polyangiales bacterium]
MATQEAVAQLRQSWVSTQVLRLSSDQVSMEISGIARLATAMSQQKTAQEADVTILKKALDMQKETAAAMVASVTPSASLLSHLGQNVNVVA